jgi:Predicted dehydrogenases and related proteins
MYSGRDAAEMIKCAKDNNVLLMEAMWTRFFPIIDTLREIIISGRAGKVLSVHSAFSYRAELDKKSRLFDPMLAGGGLLDVGVYPLHFSDIVYDSVPLDIFGYADLGTDENHIEVDEQASIIAQYSGCATAVMSCGIRTDMPGTAVIYASEATITVPDFWKPTKLVIQFYDNKTEKFEKNVGIINHSYIDEGFQYEIRHMCGCIQAGAVESPVMTYEKSLSIMRLCDKLRKQWKLKYPFETQ